MTVHSEAISGGLLARATHAYNAFLATADPRVADWPMMSSPLPTIAIVFAYLVGVVWYGQRVMQQRKHGYELRGFMLAYNFCMVAYSGWLVYEFCVSGWVLGGYSLGCQPVDRSHRTQALRMASACWWFYVSKFIELTDTALFVLRRKFSLVTFLHVLHHAVMPILWWTGVKFVPGGFSTFHALLNSSIHFMMYTYYGLAAAGPQFSRYIWWKRYMTSAQIVQFMLILAHSLQMFFLKDCDYPIVFVYAIITPSAVFLVLFTNFYVKAYLFPNQNKIKKSE